MTTENLELLWDQWIGSKDMVVKLKPTVNFLGSHRFYKEKFLKFAEEFIGKNQISHNLLKKCDNNINKVLVRTMGKWLQITGMFDNDDKTNKYLSTHNDEGVVACFGHIVITANLHDQGQNVTVKE